MSAIIGIRCDECGRLKTDALDTVFVLLEERAEKEGWTFQDGIDICPFCAARRKAKEQAEAAAK